MSHVPEGKSLAQHDGQRRNPGRLHCQCRDRPGRKAARRRAAKPIYPTDTYRELIPDADKAAAEWYRRTRILPMHGAIVIKDEVAAANPDLPRKLYEAFKESKKRISTACTRARPTRRAMRRSRN